MAEPIEFYFDPTSPYAYLASTQIDKLAARHGRTVDWRPVLIGVTILQVMGLKPVPQTPLKGPYSNQDKHRLAALLGVPLRERGATPMASPVAALRAFVWLKRRDPVLAAEFARRMCAAAWAQGRDIGDDTVLQEAAALGVDRAPLAEGMTSEDIKAQLRDDVQLAISRGVFGVPFFIADGEPFWGVDRLGMLEHWLRHQRWDHHDIERPTPPV